MSGECEIKNLMQTAMANIREMIDVNTIIGEMLESGNGTTIIPVSKVSCGFFAGGGEYGKENLDNFPFAGGSGAGVSLQPVGFLIVNNDQIRLIGVDGSNTIERMLDAAPLFIDTLKELIDKDKNLDKDKKPKEEKQTLNTY
ncbi:MAG: GerW family sporulation protein [Bacillota bacterium]|jgi:sporulation protein YtfJ